MQHDKRSELPPVRSEQNRSLLYNLPLKLNVSFVTIHLKMVFLRGILMLIFVISDETLEFVRGPSRPLVAPLGGSVVLPCYVETPLVKALLETVKVVWRRTDSETLVHLYQDGESRPEAQHKDYRDRAHFFTDQIEHGNFSLRLDDLRAEDNGDYMCKVYSQQAADKTLVQIKVVEHLVSGSDESISASVGEDVTLNCSVDSHITPEHIEEVSWKKTDEDGDILVLLYQNNETFPDSSDEQYIDRVEFFTDEIPKGNFSLRLKRVRTEDKGVYMCLVFAGGLSANATVVLERLGFSVSHVLVLILCVSGSGSALLLYWLVHSRSEDRDTRPYHLLCAVLSATILCMLLASAIWHVIEGSLHETICCCLFYILEPLRLIWVSPYSTDFTEKMETHITLPHADHAVFMAVMYSVLLAEHFKNINLLIRTATFGLLVLMFLVLIAQLVKEKSLSCCGLCCKRICSKIQQLVTTLCFSSLPSLQLTLLLYYYSGSEYIFAVLPVLPVLHLVFFFFFDPKWLIKNCLNFLTKLIWIMVIAMNAVMVYSYIMLLRNEKDGAGLVCVAGSVQVLWVLAFSEVPVCYPNFHKRKLLFLCGSVGLVTVNAVALMTEVIMKAVNGSRLLGDLRIPLLLSEGPFTIALLLFSLITATRKPVSADSLEDSQMLTDFKSTPGSKCTSRDLNQKTGDSHEMESLEKVAGNNEEQEVEIC